MTIRDRLEQRILEELRGSGEKQRVRELEAELAREREVRERLEKKTNLLERQPWEEGSEETSIQPSTSSNTTALTESLPPTFTNTQPPCRPPLQSRVDHAVPVLPSPLRRASRGPLVMVYAYEGQIEVEDGKNLVSIASRSGIVRALAAHKGILYDAGDHGVWTTLHPCQVDTSSFNALISYKGSLLGGGDEGIYDISQQDWHFPYHRRKVNALASYQGQLYAGGPEGVTRVNDGAFLCNKPVMAFAINNGKLIAGGKMVHYVCMDPRPYLGELEGVLSLAAQDGNLFFGLSRASEVRYRIGAASNSQIYLKSPRKSTRFRAIYFHPRGRFVEQNILKRRFRDLFA